MSMGLVIFYPVAKRYTYWPQVMLGKHCVVAFSHDNHIEVGVFVNIERYEC